MSTIRLTMAQALVRYLTKQFTIVDGEKVPLFPGVFAIFGHVGPKGGCRVSKWLYIQTVGMRYMHLVIP